MTKLDPKNNVDQIFVDNCVYRLENIKVLKNDHKYRNITKNFLTDPNFLILAYLQIKSKPGSTASFIDKVTLDGVDEKWFINAAKKIKDNTYAFKPAKLIEIPKFNSKILRPLTIGTSRDKIIQKAISILFTQIYEFTENIFLNTSHGFRPGFSLHTALKEIKTKWTGLIWYIKSDVEKAFDSIQRNVLINLLNKKVCDHRLTDLIRKMFNCRILAPSGFYFKNNQGVPQGNVMSPLLCNVYLHEFDVFMETLNIKYHKGKYPTPNPEYFKKIDLGKYVRILSHELQDKIRKGNRRQLFNKGIKPYLHDDNYIRLKYIRFVNDLLIGVRGSKKIAKKIETESNNWLDMNLHLKLNEKKTLLTYGIGNKIKFLGFYLFHVSYNQLPYRNSRCMEKIKRIRNRILARKAEVDKKSQKRLKINLIRIIKKKLEISANISTKFILNEIGEAFVNNLKNQVKKEGSYRGI